MNTNGSGQAVLTTEAPHDFSVLAEVAYRRHSCRAFTDEEVAEEIVDAIVRTAQQAASWCNAQPWAVDLVSGPALRELSDQTHAEATNDRGTAFDLDTPTYRGETLARRRAAGWALYDAVGLARGDRAASRAQALANFRFFGAPHVAIISSCRDLGSYGVLDCGAFVNAFMMAATSLGIATIAQAAAVSHGPTVRRLLEISDDRVLVCGIAFGYEDHAHPANSFRTERVSVDGIIRRHRELDA